MGLRDIRNTPPAYLDSRSDSSSFLLLFPDLSPVHHQETAACPLGQPLLVGAFRGSDSFMEVDISQQESSC